MKEMTRKEKDMNVAKAFMKEACMVHISKSNGQFYNGTILKVFEEFFTIDDQKLGPINVFFFELKKPLQEYTGRKY